MKSRPALGSLLAVVVLLGIVLAIVQCGCSQTQGAAADAQSATTQTFQSGSIVVAGLVDYPMTLTDLDLDYMDWFSGTTEHPDLGVIEYEAVRLSDVLWYVGVQSEARTVTVTSMDGSSVDVALEDMTDKDAGLVVTGTGALDVVIPTSRGKTWFTDVVAMEFK